MIKVGDIVQFNNAFTPKKVYTIVAMDEINVTKLRSNLTQVPFDGYWPISHLTLVTSSEDTLKNKVEAKILYLDKKAEKLKLATLSKQADVLSVPSLEETDRETTWRSTAMGTHTVSHVDTRRVGNYTTDFAIFLRAVMVQQEAWNGSVRPVQGAW